VPSPHSVAMHQDMSGSAIDVVRQAVNLSGHSLLLQAEQVEQRGPAEEPLEAVGMREEAQGALKQMLVQRGAGRRAFTAEPQQVTLLLNRLSRHVTAGCWCGGIGAACAASAALALWPSRLPAGLCHDS
jgi:hypothetical protein